jgi:hypothetical protein
VSLAQLVETSHHTHELIFESQTLHLSTLKGGILATKLFDKKLKKLIFKLPKLKILYLIHFWLKN